ncbi:hypothetical protein R1sor_004615 [Riccia sorocarpa]|uniref:Reverse transcriptase zinc-binding domain-containing protein n=1 Tax=Riccia sorocarpa TaxID=122646 RepID=A0ABD3HNN5_9MARC
MEGWSKPSKFWLKLRQQRNPPEDLTYRWTPDQGSIIWKERWPLLWRQTSTTRVKLWLWRALKHGFFINSRARKMRITAGSCGRCFPTEAKKNPPSPPPLVLILHQAREEAEACFSGKSNERTWRKSLATLKELNDLIKPSGHTLPPLRDMLRLSINAENLDEDRTVQQWADITYLNGENEVLWIFKDSHISSRSEQTPEERMQSP